MAIIDVDCPPTLKEIAAQDSEQSDTYSASDRYIRHMIIYLVYLNWACMRYITCNQSTVFLSKLLFPAIGVSHSYL